MKKSRRRNYIKNTSKIIIRKIRTIMKKSISSITVSLISTLVTKLIFSRKTITRYTKNSIINSKDTYFIILSAMILLTYYYLHKH